MLLRLKAQYQIPKWLDVVQALGQTIETAIMAWVIKTCPHICNGKNVTCERRKFEVISGHVKHLNAYMVKASTVIRSYMWFEIVFGHLV